MVIFEGPDPPTPKLADVLRQGGSAITLKDAQPSKAESPISVRLGGRMILLKDVHP